MARLCISGAEADGGALPLLSEAVAGAEAELRGRCALAIRAEQLHADSADDLARLAALAAKGALQSLRVKNVSIQMGAAAFYRKERRWAALVAALQRHRRRLRHLALVLTPVLRPAALGGQQGARPAWSLHWSQASSPAGSPADSDSDCDSDSDNDNHSDGNSSGNDAGRAANGRGSSGGGAEDGRSGRSRSGPPAGHSAGTRRGHDASDASDTSHAGGGGGASSGGAPAGVQSAPDDKAQAPACLMRQLLSTSFVALRHLQLTLPLAFDDVRAVVAALRHGRLPVLETLELDTTDALSTPLTTADLEALMEDTLEAVAGHEALETLLLPAVRATRLP